MDLGVIHHPCGIRALLNLSILAVWTRPLRAPHTRTCGSLYLDCPSGGSPDPLNNCYHDWKPFQNVKALLKMQSNKWGRPASPWGDGS